MKEKSFDWRFWTKKVLLIGLVLLVAWKYQQFRPEYQANKDIFSFIPQKDIDFLSEDLTINKSMIETEQELRIRYDRALIPGLDYTEQEELTKDRCIYMYPLLQRWIIKYLQPILHYIAFMLVVVVVLNIDWKKWVKKSKKLAERLENE